MLKAKRLPFVIELPPYRRPNWASVTRNMLSKAGAFLFDAGTVIVVCSMVLWGSPHSHVPSNPFPRLRRGPGGCRNRRCAQANRQ